MIPSTRLPTATLPRGLARDSVGSANFSQADNNRELSCIIGVDVGGTKCAAGALRMHDSGVIVRQCLPTRPERGGQAVLDDVIALVQAVNTESSQSGFRPMAIGLGLAELVGCEGQVDSEATIRWQGLPIASLLREATGLPAFIDADVRAAARAEAQHGAGRSYNTFLYVTVGTGISAALVIDGRPFRGARGLTGTFASSRLLVPLEDGGLAGGPPLEHYAAGPALAARFAKLRPGFVGTAADVLACSAAGDRDAIHIMVTAGRALGATVAQLVSLLDPEAVVVGGGLGLAGGMYWQAFCETMRAYVWSEYHRDIPVLPAALGTDAGWIGAALGVIA